MKYFGVLVFCLFTSLGNAQHAAELTDTLSLQEEFFEDDDTELIAPADTLRIECREFSGAELKKLRADPDLKFKEPPTIVESLWDRFLRWLTILIQKILNGAVTTNWGRVVAYVIGLTVVVVIVMMILKVNAFKVFYSGEGSNAPFSVLDENIHEMDFEKLIHEALQRQDYRNGVRLIFLYALKMLSDKNLVHWEQGKTNHDYLNELQAHELKNGFHELNYYFEYAWYGNFSISKEMFSTVQSIFSAWKNNLN